MLTLKNGGFKKVTNFALYIYVLAIWNHDMHHSKSSIINKQDVMESCEIKKIRSCAIIAHIIHGRSVCDMQLTVSKFFFGDNQKNGKSCPPQRYAHFCPTSLPTPNHSMMSYLTRHLIGQSRAQALKKNGQVSQYIILEGQSIYLVMH